MFTKALTAEKKTSFLVGISNIYSALLISLGLYIDSNSAYQISYASGRRVVGPSLDFQVNIRPAMFCHKIEN